MDERIDILDENGRYTGKTALKSEAHKKGYFHPSIHLWLYTSNEKLLLQKRATTKKVFPNLWDVSVAGHVKAGETVSAAVLREAQEEIGLKLNETELTLITIRKHNITHPNGIIDKEWNHVFIAELKTTVDTLTPQQDEVDSLQLFELTTLKNTPKLNNVLLPAYHEYYCFVYNAVKQILND